VRQQLVASPGVGADLVGPVRRGDGKRSDAKRDAKLLDGIHHARACARLGRATRAGDVW
jgi:hypothetical protein